MCQKNWKILSGGLPFKSKSWRKLTVFTFFHQRRFWQNAFDIGTMTSKWPHRGRRWDWCEATWSCETSSSHSIWRQKYNCFENYNYYLIQVETLSMTLDCSSGGKWMTAHLKLVFDLIFPSENTYNTSKNLPYNI